MLDKINKYMSSKINEDAGEGLEIIEDVSNIKDEEIYDKNPKDIRYSTKELTTEQEVERKINKMDIDDIKFAFKGGIF